MGDGGTSRGLRLLWLEVGGSSVVESNRDGGGGVGRGGDSGGARRRLHLLGDYACRRRSSRSSNRRCGQALYIDIEIDFRVNGLRGRRGGSGRGCRLNGVVMNVGKRRVRNRHASGANGSRQGREGKERDCKESGGQHSRYASKKDRPKRVIESGPAREERRREGTI
jgi:hypothetical protein